MSHDNKIEQLRRSLQQQKEAQAKKEAAQGQDLSVGMAEKYQEKIAQLEHSLEKALVECEELKKKANDTHEQFVRTYADYENYRKRVDREKGELAKYGSEKIVQELLPALDSLEKAIEHADESSDIKQLVEGVELVLKHILQALEKFGLYPLDAEGKPFDPHHHEAMAQHESEEHEPDTVVKQHRRGYKLHDRLLRPALVTVAKPPKKEPDES